MSVIDIDLSSLETINFNGNEDIEKLVLNDNLIWEKSKDDTYILNVTSGTYRESESVEIKCVKFVVYANKQAIVTFNNETQIIPIGESTVTFNLTDETTGNITFTGDFKFIIPFYVSDSQLGDSYGAIINQIIKFQSKVDYTYLQQFSHQKLNFNIIIPQNIKKLISGIFYHITAVTTNKPILILPNDITEIDCFKIALNNNSYPFSNIAYENGLYYSGEWAIDSNVYLIDNTGSTSQILKTYTIKEGITKLANNLFSGVTSFSYNTTNNEIRKGTVGTNAITTTIVLSSTISQLGKGCFENCSALNSINLTPLISIIPESCFLGCAFANFTFGSNIKLIETGAFENNSTLTALTFEHSANDEIVINDNAFKQKSAIESITVTTDNFNIANYNWQADNYTTRILKKSNGDSWAVTITPTATIENKILTITGSDAISYEITGKQTNSTTTFPPTYTKYFTESSINIETLFPEITFTTGASYSFTLYGLKGTEAVRSDKVNISYTGE